MENHKITSSLKKHLLFLFLSLFLTFNSSFGYVKYVLIVAIGNQPTDTRWTPTSAINDSKVMENNFKQMAFDSIIVLNDEDATKDAVLKEFAKAKNKLNKGDLFFFYFAGHGQKIVDYNSDEIDGYDESLVLYGAPSEFDQWYRNEHHLTDDDFSAQMDLIRAKVGEHGQVISLIDAGFGSADGIKGDSLRGWAKALAPADYQSRSNYIDVNHCLYDNRPFRSPSTKYAPMISISATQGNQAAMEYNGNGILTLAFDRAMEVASDTQTYQQLFRRMQITVKEMQKNQVMALEGSFDKALFKGDSKVQTTAFRSSSLESAIPASIQASLIEDTNDIRIFYFNQDPRITSLF